MTLYQFLLAAWARRGIFLTVLLATVLVTAVVSMLMPKTYIATSSLLIDAREEQ